MTNQIMGYIYINASKDDKKIYLYIQFDDINKYIIPFIFPKYAASYIFFYRDFKNSNNLWVSGKSGNTLSDAMNQNNMLLREKIKIIIIGDQKKSTINFMSDDSNDKSFELPLFDENKFTENQKNIEKIIRTSISTSNAGSKMAGWVVNESNIYTFKDPGIVDLMNKYTQLDSYVNKDLFENQKKKNKQNEKAQKLQSEPNDFMIIKNPFEISQTVSTKLISTNFIVNAVS
jgi:hypothetical protein